MRRFTGFLLSVLFSVPAWAGGNLADLEIRDRTSGRTLPVYEDGGRWFVAGKPGNEYQVTVRNRSREDLLAVVSVDGINVVSGETASPWQGGYVIDRGRSLSIKGWRKDLDRVAAFYFTDLGDSYAARTGRPGNIGVIGVALFKRKPEPVAETAPLARPESGAAADSSKRRAEAPSTAQKGIGTGHGRNQNSPARYVEFERASDEPGELIAIHYDTYDNLVARGIIREPRRWPSPFPGSFVPDPPGRG